MYLRHGNDGEDLDVVPDLVRDMEYLIGFVLRVVAATAGAGEGLRHPGVTPVRLIVMRQDVPRLLEKVF